MAKILLVEDDKILSETLTELLEDEGYDVTLVAGANDALSSTYEANYDLFLLDVNIEDFDGFKLLEMLRDSGDKTPAIFLTSLSDIASLSKGFEVGGDDYIKKPFDFDELLVRIQSQLRKSFKVKENEILYKDLLYKISTNELFKNNSLLKLTPSEQKLVSIFFKRLGESVSKQDIFYELDSTNESSEGALRVYIHKLRKIGLDIQTIKGVGYRCVKA